MTTTDEDTDQKELVYVFYETTSGIVEEVLVTKIKSLADKWVNAFLRENGFSSSDEYDAHKRNYPMDGSEYELFETVLR